jgi:glycosyltransferase involved in cell wall biosynthesis
MVSVIIPVYNFTDHLKEAIESCLRQTTCKEILIIDDASTEPINQEALELIQSNPIIRLIRNPINLSLAGSRNVGFSEASFDWVLPLDSDDFLEGNSLDHMVSQIDDISDVIYGNMYEGSLKRWISPKQKFSIKDFQLDNPIFGCSLVRKEAWKKVGGYTVREDYKVHYEDYNFWAKLFASKCTFKYVNVMVYHHRYRESSMSDSMKKDVNFFRDLAIEGIFPPMKVAFCVAVKDYEYNLVEPLYESLKKFSEFQFGLLVFSNIENVKSDKWTMVDLNAPIGDRYKDYSHVIQIDIRTVFTSPISRFSFR